MTQAKTSRLSSRRAKTVRPSKSGSRPKSRSRPNSKTAVKKFFNAAHLNMAKGFSPDFELFVKHIPAAVAVFDRNMNYLMCSDRWIEDYGLKNKNMIGRSHYEIFPEIPDRWKKIHQRCLAGAVEKSDEDFFIRSNGQVDWNRWEIHPWYDGEGKIGGIIMFTEVYTHYKLIEQKLVESEERFRSIFKEAPVGMVTVSMEGRFLQVNPAFCRFLGYTAKELEGMSVVNVTFPKDQPETQRALDNYRSGGSYVIDIEKRYLTKDQRTVWGHVKSTVLQDNAGRPICYVTVVEDITEKRMAEEALKESQARYRLATHAGHVGVWDWDLITDELYIDPNLKALLGYEEDEIKNKMDDWQKHIFPEDRKKLNKAVGRHINGQTSQFEVEIRMVHKDGSLRWFLGRGSLIRDKAGSIIRMIGTDTDITDRKAMQLALEENRARYELASNAGLVGVWDADLSSGAIFVDPVIKTMLGYRQDEIANHRDDWERYFYPEDLKRSNEALENHINGKTPQYEAAVRLRHKNGEYVWVLARGTALRDKEGRAYRLIGTTTNINDRMKAELIQRGRNKVLERLAEGAVLKDVLLTLIEHLEEICPTMRCSVLLLDKDMKYLHNFVAPSMPEEYMQAVDHIEIGPGVGSCGTAAYTGERMIVEDVLTHSYWMEFREHAHKAGFRACWSEPIISSSYRVLGTFAMYYPDVRAPQDEDIEMIMTAARLASIAIEHRQAEENVKQALREKDVLLKEVHHRVKNNLQIISSLFDLQFEHVRDQQTQEMARKNQERIKAISFVHEMLYQSMELSGIDFDEYIDKLTRYLLSMYRSDEKKVSLSIDVVSPPVNINTAILCGLIINELTTNSLKHAFPHQGGEILIEFKKDAAGLYHLNVSDSGIGFPKGLDIFQQSSLGLQLVDTLVKQLGGEYRLESRKGARFVMTFKGKGEDIESPTKG